MGQSQTYQARAHFKALAGVLTRHWRKVLWLFRQERAFRLVLISWHAMDEIWMWRLFWVVLAYIYLIKKKKSLLPCIVTRYQHQLERPTSAKWASLYVIGRMEFLPIWGESTWCWQGPERCPSVQKCISWLRRRCRSSRSEFRTKKLQKKNKFKK